MCTAIRAHMRLYKLVQQGFHCSRMVAHKQPTHAGVVVSFSECEVYDSCQLHSFLCQTFHHLLGSEPTNGG